MEAFQKPPFQANAFQESPSFSVAAFQRCAFQYGAFQVDPCVKSDAQSGVRRLAMYQLQEEHLKRDEQRFKEQVQEAMAKDQAPAAPNPARAKHTLEPLVKLIKLDKPDFKRRPIVSTPSPVSTSLAAQLNIWSAETQRWFLQYMPVLQEQRRVIMEKRKAENDADYRLRLLLLAA